MTMNKKCYFTYGSFGGGEVNEWGKVFLDRKKAEDYCDKQEPITHCSWFIEELDLE